MDHSSVVESTQRSYLNKSKDNIMKNITVKSQKLWVSESVFYFDPIIDQIN